MTAYKMPAIQEFQHEIPAITSPVDADGEDSEEDGFTSDKPPFLREISLSADNIPVNDCPLTRPVTPPRPPLRFLPPRPRRHVFPPNYYQFS